MLFVVLSECPVAFHHIAEVYQGLKRQQSIRFLFEELEEIDQQGYWIFLKRNKVLVSLFPILGGRARVVELMEAVNKDGAVDLGKILIRLHIKENYSFTIKTALIKRGSDIFAESFCSFI